MQPHETVLLTAYIEECCPSQHIGEYTADAWHDLLSDLDLADCRTAVQIVAKRQPWVSPSEIRAEVRRMRDERLERKPIPAPPAELLDDPAAYNAHLYRSAQAISRPAADQPAIESRPHP